MNWKQIKEISLRDILNTLEEAFHALGVDFYLIGAFAKDHWYSSKGLRTRQTKDVDFAVLVQSAAVYQALRAYLKGKQFIDTKENAFVMISPDGVQVDILPFGEIEIDGHVTFEGEGMTSISVNGFREVYEAGTESIDMQTKYSFKAATLPAIVLLKLIAYDDRPEQRLKDAGDIAGILMNYFELQSDLIYDHHHDLFEKEERELTEIAAIVVGREIKKICADNSQLHNRIQRIVSDEIDKIDKSAFLRAMMRETGKTLEEMNDLLMNMLEGITL